MGHSKPLGAEEHIRQGQEFIGQVKAKMDNLVAEFAQGKINTSQFHKLYGRYDRQISVISHLLVESDPALWREVVEKDGVEDTVVIRQRLTAKAIGMAIYDNQSGIPIETLGNFQVDTALLVPMLSSYKSATEEMFSAGMRSSAMENGSWLCFMPGEHTTLITLFSLEPASDQLETLERMHRDFEEANRNAIEVGDVDPEVLAYPFLAFIKRVRSD